MKSIFEIENRLIIEKEFKKLYQAFFKDSYAIYVKNGYSSNPYKFESYLNADVFLKWKYRDTFTSVKEYLENVGISFKQVEEYRNYSLDEQLFLYFIEFFLNMFRLVKNEKNIQLSSSLIAYRDNLKIILEKMNYEPKELNDKIIITKRNADIDSVLNVVSSDIANNLLEYNDYRVRNNIDIKKTILKNLDLYIEKNIKEYDSELKDSIGTIVNKMGVNHPIKEEPYINLSNEELLAWYDKCFLLMIHAIRSKEIKRIKEERKKLVQKS